MPFLNNFCSWLRIELKDPPVSWMEVFVTKIGGFQFLVIATGDLVLDAAGVLYLIPFAVTHIC